MQRTSYIHYCIYIPVVLCTMIFLFESCTERPKIPRKLRLIDSALSREYSRIRSYDTTSWWKQQPWKLDTGVWVGFIKGRLHLPLRFDYFSLTRYQDSLFTGSTQILFRYGAFRDKVDTVLQCILYAKQRDDTVTIDVYDRSNMNTFVLRLTGVIERYYKLDGKEEVICIHGNYDPNDNTLLTPGFFIFDKLSPEDIQQIQYEKLQDSLQKLFREQYRDSL